MREYIEISFAHGCGFVCVYYGMYTGYTDFIHRNLAKKKTFEKFLTKTVTIISLFRTTELFILKMQDDG